MEGTKLSDVELARQSLVGATSSVGARATIAGALVTIGLQLLFIAFGAAVGLSAAPSAARGMGIWMVVWTLCTIAASGFVGGWVASTAARAHERSDGMLNAFVTWAIVALLVTTALGGLVANAVAAAFGLAQSMPGAAPDVSARQVTSAAGLSLWFYFVLMALPLITSILGGAYGARSIARRLGPLVERRAVSEPRAPTTPPVPTPA